MLDTPISNFDRYDFIDFGCSNGGSIKWANSVFPGSRGIGIDIAPNKIEATRAAGYDAVLLDALELGTSPRIVDFCILSHFLEQLNSYRDAKAMLTKACAAAKFATRGLTLMGGCFRTGLNFIGRIGPATRFTWTPCNYKGPCEIFDRPA